MNKKHIKIINDNRQRIIEIDGNIEFIVKVQSNEIEIYGLDHHLLGVIGYQNTARFSNIFRKGKSYYDFLDGAMHPVGRVRDTKMSRDVCILGFGENVYTFNRATNYVALSGLNDDDIMIALDYKDNDVIEGLTTMDNLQSAFVALYGLIRWFPSRIHYTDLKHEIDREFTADHLCDEHEIKTWLFGGK